MRRGDRRHPRQVDAPSVEGPHLMEVAIFVTVVESRVDTLQARQVQHATRAAAGEQVMIIRGVVLGVVARPAPHARR